ncbi:MAG: 5-formyltetrahydrofolate cyclo-ligase [Verrucomicrobiota bacterium]
MSAVAEAKALMRSEVRARISAMPEERRASESAEVVRNIVADGVWKGARSVLLFMPLPDEVRIRPLVDAAWATGKSVALPASDAATGAYVAKRVLSAADLRPGRFGVLEPCAGCPVVPFSALDLVLVSGIAFDMAGNRLGRGRGFYDRMLALSPDAVSCGVGFDGQIVALVPVEPHDVKLHRVWTPAGQILAGAARL